MAWVHGKDGASDREELFSERLACDVCGISLPELTPQMFSFNSPQGACTECDGMGKRCFSIPTWWCRIIRLSIREGAIKPWENRDRPTISRPWTPWPSTWAFDLVQALVQAAGHGAPSAALRHQRSEVEFYLDKRRPGHYFRGPGKALSVASGAALPRDQQPGHPR
jgi:excinuclease ABC subunit A